MGLYQERHARDDLARGAGNALFSALDWAGISLVLIASSILIGDHIEPQRDAKCLQATAGMFESDAGVPLVQHVARTHAIVRPDSACFVNPTGAGAQPAADHRGRECERTFYLIAVPNGQPHAKETP